MNQAAKRILSLDGGGVRGIVELAFLEHIENILKARAPNADTFRLCDYFDLIGGTSTGSIIAASLATGQRASYVRKLYEDLAPKVFRKDWWRVTGLQSRFAAKPLADVLDRELGDISLEDSSIKTHLALVTKRVDTGSPWIVSNIRSQPYWNDPSDESYTGNRHLKLRSLIRASTAAPYYFGPERIPISAGLSTGLFIDGGVSPYNDPAIPLLMLASLAPYGLRWKVAENQLLLISIGAGTFRETISQDGVQFKPAGRFALEALHGLIGDAQVASQTILQWLSYSPQPWKLNSEIGDLTDEFLAGTPLFTYQRYDLKLEQEWLKKYLDVTVTEREVKNLRRLDQPGNMAELFKLATQAATLQVKPEHFATKFDKASNEQRSGPTSEA